jgi:hypothetical protein
MLDSLEGICPGQAGLEYPATSVPFSKSAVLRLVGVVSTVAKRMRRAYTSPDPLVAQAELEALARELDRAHPGAAASLREGWPRPWPSPSWACHQPRLDLRCTNAIESMIEICRDHAANARALAGRADGPALDRRRDGRGPPPVTPASTATCIYRPYESRSTRPSLLSHPARRMPSDPALDRHRNSTGRGTSSLQNPLMICASSGCRLLRGRPRGVSSQAPELRERKIGITPFDCPCDSYLALKKSRVR